MSPLELMQKKRWRRTLLIYPRFQSLMILFNTAILLGSFVAVFTSVEYGFMRLHEMGVQAGLPADGVYFKFIAYQGRLLYTCLFTAMGAAVVLSYLITLVLSHRLAGPIVRLKNHFTELKRTGRWRPLSFRENDYFTDLPPIINEAMDSLPLGNKDPDQKAA